MSRENGVVALAVLQFAATSLMPLGIRSISVKVGHMSDTKGGKENWRRKVFALYTRKYKVCRTLKTKTQGHVSIVMMMFFYVNLFLELGPVF